MRIGGFGHDFPFGLFAALGHAALDVTLPPGPPDGMVPEGFEALVEPFMDPFARAILLRLWRGEMAGLGALVFHRESPGALPAYHAACELRRLGLMAEVPPRLVLCNLVLADGAAAEAFNRTEIEAMRLALAGADIAPVDGTVLRARDAAVAALLSDQSAGRIDGAAAFELRRRAGAAGLDGAAAILRERPVEAVAQGGPRMALLGAPMGDASLHRAVCGAGVLALDQQALSAATGDRGDGVGAALAAHVGNPFAARQARDVFAGAIGAELAAHRIDRVLWQVDPHDDLWGWLAPEVRTAAEARGCGFTDLGYVPRCPGPADLARVAEALEGGR